MTASIKRFLFLTSVILFAISSASLAGPFDEGSTKKRKCFT
jgi:hypothetical protein